MNAIDKSSIVLIEELAKGGGRTAYLIEWPGAPSGRAVYKQATNSITAEWVALGNAVHAALSEAGAAVAEVYAIDAAGIVVEYVTPVTEDEIPDPERKHLVKDILEIGKGHLEIDQLPYLEWSCGDLAKWDNWGISESGAFVALDI